MAIALRYAARSDLGLGSKSRNEDSGYAGPHLLVLADGMGGHAAGDVASSMVVGELVHLDGESHGADDALEQLGLAVRDANTALHEAMADMPETEGMGTTLIAMLRAGDKIALANIGDSRAYRLRDGSFSQITRDHSFVQKLLDEGRITPAEAEHHPQRSLVTRVLTGDPGDEPDLSMREARVGDRYLLCSDGLSDFVGSDTIEEVMREGASPAEIADRLIKIALRASTRDNVTVVVAEVVDLARTPAPSTQAQVVGAATDRVNRTQAVPQTPAEKAAALHRSVQRERAAGAAGGTNVLTHDRTGTSGPEESADGTDERPLLAESGPGSRTGRWIRRVALVVVILAVLVGGGWGAWSWTQQQYYVGVHDGHVAIYRGLSQDLGPISLHSVARQTDIPVRELSPFARGKVTETMTADNKADAEHIVTELRTELIQCRIQSLGGAGCRP
ncbi:MAG TPA: protein phosphatase 2C domain-containing protein [Segeticoccus sp.]|uniref:PP2C family protein-serine/threonine phosphatase n=1 Tax=Segeticoccus sp. TaxID=2706531 RepID=UPI002D7F3FB9|nr:protein phosphatase 2C domain-containing protein [Segeticoccus sp.]HET8599197.1 protein phosphatase 2C domain-containing protein [Segeticoccus sp.]